MPEENAIEFFTAVSTRADTGEALDDLVAQISEALDADPAGAGLNFGMVFASSHFAHEMRSLVDGLRQAFRPGLLLGCTAEGVIGSQEEIEETPAIALAVAHLVGIQAAPVLLQPTDTDWHRLLLDPEEFRRTVDAPADTRLFILLGDPFSTPMDDVLRAFNTVYAGIPAVGGMASGALRPQGNVLFVNDRLTHEGVVGVALSGGVEVDILVSQGCRPIWRPFRVEAAHANVIHNLEGRPPLAWIQDLIPKLSNEDRRLLQKGLFVGRAIKTSPEDLGRGDYLIRGVIGIDQESGALAIGDSIMEGEIIQFHLRDAITAQEDLEMMLIPQAFRDPPSGALLFTCNGRGLRLYDHPNGDISIIQQNLNGIQLAGFFCAGEIGPVRGENFLHGHTASLVLFRPTQTDDSEENFS